MIKNITNRSICSIFSYSKHPRHSPNANPPSLARKYVLMADISLKDTDWYPINFSGTFNGNGYTIYDLKTTQMNSESNISVDGNAKKYETYFSGLFGQAKNAVIQNRL